MVFSPFFALGRAIGLVSAPSNSPLVVVGIDNFNTTVTSSTHSKTVTPPGSADAVLVIATCRANGASVAYAGTCTVNGETAARVEGNETGNPADNAFINIAFLIRGSFNAATPVPISVAYGNTVRPGGFSCIFLRNTRVATAVGGHSVTRASTSSATLGGSVTAESTDSVVILMASVSLSSGTPTVSSFTPSDAVDLGLSQVGSTLGARTVRYFVPASAGSVTLSTTWSASNTNRGLIAVEIVR